MLRGFPVRPTLSCRADRKYVFKPTAIDDDGDFLTFEISGKPRWARSHAATWAIVRHADNSDAGTVAPIVITVTDGRLCVSLVGFSITVQPAWWCRPTSMPVQAPEPAHRAVLCWWAVPLPGDPPRSINPSPPSGHHDIERFLCSSGTAGSTTSSTSSGSLNPAPATTTPAAAPSNQAPRIRRRTAQLGRRGQPLRLPAHGQ